MNGSESPQPRVSESAASSASASAQSNLNNRANTNQTHTNRANTNQANTRQASKGHHAHVHHGSGGHSHVHDEESIRRIVNRLSRIEGHIRGIKRMVQEQENCPDVLIQVAAVRGALDKVSRLILDEHLAQCIVRAAQQGNIEDELAELQAALNRFLPS